ncbi:hypothetical protein JZ751_019922, partial [Albula glossodonta]
MADTLRTLVNSSSFSVLQDKLESWYKDYHVISCDQNLNRCCELVELTSKVQGQLFSILHLTAREGGQYGGVDTIKSRLLPWLGTCFTMTTGSISPDTSLNLIQESVGYLINTVPIGQESVGYLINTVPIGQERLGYLINTVPIGQESMGYLINTKMETQLSTTRQELDTIKQESVLPPPPQYCPTPSVLPLPLSTAPPPQYCPLPALEEYERQVRMLREEVSYLSTEKALLQDRLVRSRSPSPLPRRSRSSSPLRGDSPTRAQLTASSRHARLVSRFGDLYALQRLQSEALVRRYVSDMETAQRIIFIATVESFQAAKLAYRQFKLRVRKTLSPTHLGPESLEDAVVDYIVRNLDLYDVQASVNASNGGVSLRSVLPPQEVISSMNLNPKIALPAELDFTLLSSFIRELVSHLCFRYRRSYDSEFTAPLVVYHIWPALMEDSTVIMKGEAVTRRGALVICSSSHSAPPPGVQAEVAVHLQDASQPAACGAQTLSGGAQTLSGGVQILSGGAQTLSGGVQTLSEKPSEARALSTGMKDRTWEVHTGKTAPG